MASDYDMPFWKVPSIIAKEIVEDVQGVHRSIFGSPAQSSTPRQVCDRGAEALQVQPYDTTSIENRALALDLASWPSRSRMYSAIANELVEDVSDSLDRLTAVCRELKDDTQRHLQRLSSPLEELNRDSGLCGLAVMGLVAGSSVASGPVGLALSGFSITSKTACIVVGVIMAGGALSVWTRGDEECWKGDGAIVHGRTGAMLATTAGYYYVICSGFSIPPVMGISLINQELVMHCLLDTVSIPILLANAGFIAGKSPGQLAGKITFAAVANFCFSAAAGLAAGPWFPTARMLCVVGTLCMLKVQRDMCSELPVEGRKVSAVNQLRTQVLSDMTVFSWGITPVFVVLQLIGADVSDAHFKMFAVVDCLCKLGTSHLFLRHREAFVGAVKFLEAARRPAA